MTASLIAFFVALFASIFLAVPVRALALRVGMVDLPGPRKVHLQPIPLLGGLAIYGARFGRFPLDPTVLFMLRP